MTNMPFILNQLLSGELANDPRIHQAKQLVLEAIEEKQKKIVGIRPPISGLKHSYSKLLADFAELRGNRLYYPYIGSGFGKGVFVELLDGSIKYDFISGIGVHHWGHNHLDMVSANIDAAIMNTTMQGNLQQNWDTVELSEILLHAAKLDHCFFTTSGAMANENALKIAFQKNTPANRILAFERTFAGRSLFLSQVTDKPSFRQGLPTTTWVDYVPFFDPKKPEESIKNSVAILKNHILRYPKQHAVMCMELVQGEAGFYPGNKEFFKALIEVLKENQIAVFADEVQTFGRTPQLFAFQYYELQDLVDIVTIGKLSHVCATLFTKEYQPKLGLLSQTFTASTSAIHMAKTILKKFLTEDFFGPKGRITQIYQYFSSHLEKLERKYPHLIEGPFGIGAMIAFTPFGGEAEKVGNLAQKLFEEGVISFIAGTHPTRIRFLVPAGAVTNKDIDEVVSILEATLIKQKI